MREAGDCVVMLVHEREKGDYVMPFVGQTQPDESRLVGKDNEKSYSLPSKKCLALFSDQREHLLRSGSTR
jgi:hypothetical protein